MKDDDIKENLLFRFAVYRHYKGGEYTLVGIAKLESDLTEMAIYKKAYSDAEEVFVRPLSEFKKKFKLIK
ncbi:TPA: DUF1653 domain-containing protein [Neisseria subflava]